MENIASDEESPKQSNGTDGNYAPKLKRPYDKLITDLNDDDLKSPGVHKLILSKNSELEVEIYDLKEGDKKHRALEIEHAKVSALLDNIKKTNIYMDTLYSAGLGGGTGLIGLAVSVTPLTVSFAVGATGLLLSVFSVIARIKVR